MRSRIYMGNIPFSANDAEIAEFFQGFKLADVKIITDRETGRQRGFAFVSMDDAAEAKRAIETLDGTEMGGRRIIVSEAKERNFAPRNTNGDGRTQARYENRDRD